MTPDEVQEFLTANTVLQVATIGRDGWPHVAPMWYVMDGDRVVFRSFTKSQKIVNLQRNPRFTVLVETGDDYSQLQGVMITAEAQLVTDADYVLSIYGALAAKYPMINNTPTPKKEMPDAQNIACCDCCISSYSSTGIPVKPIVTSG